jgi:hypothetical protein
MIIEVWANLWVAATAESERLAVRGQAHFQEMDAHRFFARPRAAGEE